MKKTFLIIIGFIISIFIINVMSGETDYTQSSNKNYKSNIENKHSCEKVASFYLDPEVILNSGSRSLGVKVIDAKAVQSNDYKKFYFVQYKIQTPNNGIVYPMFAMNKPTENGGNGAIYSMDELAITLSSYGDARKLKDPFSSSDDGFSAASKCLR